MKRTRTAAFAEHARRFDREARARRWPWLIAGTVSGGGIVRGAAFVEGTPADCTNAP